MSAEVQFALQELAEMRRMGLFDDRLHERARAVLRDQGEEWEAMSSSEMADLALDLARTRNTRR